MVIAFFASEMKQSVYFLGTKEIGVRCLKYLIDNHHNKDVTILGVLTNSRRLGGSQESVSEIAKENNLKIIETLEDFEKSPNADFIISVQYHKILKQKHIDKANKLAVNLHMAPLPEYRGCNQFSFAIVDQAKTFGTTLHQLVRQADSGPIIFEQRFKIPNEAFVKDLYDITFKESVNLFEQNVSNIFLGDYNLIPQENFENERDFSFHFRNEIEDLKIINEDWPTEKKKRFFRATYFPPFEPPKLLKEGELIQLTPDYYYSL